MKKKLRAFAILSVLATMVMYFINRIIFYLATIDNLLNNNDGNYYEWKFGKIFYKKQGNGTPLLLIHDLNIQSSGYEWKKVSSALSGNYTVYTIDLLGCGRSDKPFLTYTNFLYVQLITDFIKHIIGQKTDIIATGESAAFAVMACNTGEDMIGKIAMVNPMSLSELAKVPSKRTKTLRFMIQIPIIGTLLYNTLHSMKYVKENFQTKFFYNMYKADETTIKAYYEAAHTDHGRSKYLFASIKGRYTRTNILHCINSITNSIFIISGANDFESSEICEQYQKYAPAIETVSIPESKHLPQLEMPEDFIEQINIFFGNE